MSIITINPTEISHRAMHQHMLSAVAPRPICFASTISADGAVNLSPFSFFNAFSSNPPLLVFSAARGGRDNQLKHTHINARETKEVVINMVNYRMVEQMSLASTAYPRDVNEFVKAGFTEVASVKVRPPRVLESPVSFECVVEEIKELGDWPGAGNLIFARVVLMHINDQYMDPEGQLDTTKLDLVGRMGGAWYNRTTEDVLFTIPKPTRNHGIGIDALPEYIKTADWLTGNELARMGNLPQLADLESINMAHEQFVKPLLMEASDITNSVISQAKDFIANERPQDCLALLIAAENYLK